MRATLYVTGAALELVGILLIAWPDLLPYAERVSRWLRVVMRWLAERLRRLFRRRRDVVVNVGAADALAIAGSISVVVSPNPDATLEERVEYLLRREQEAQAKLNAHDERIGAMEEHVPRRLDEHRAAAEEHVESEIIAAESRYRSLRSVGVVALIAGLVMATWANFL